MNEMPIKLNGFKLRDNTISTMKGLLRDTKQDKLERGFDLCSNITTKELLARNICTGSRCQIMPKRKCRFGEGLEGGFHTHPDLTSKPSLADLVMGLQFGIECVGGVKDNSIKCFVKKQFPFREEQNITTMAVDLLGKYHKQILTKEDIREFTKLEKKIRTEYFKEFRIS